MPYVGRLFFRPTQNNNRSEEQHVHEQVSHQESDPPVQQHMGNQRHEQDVQDMQDVPGTHGMPDVPDVPDVPDTHGMPDMQDVQHVQDEQGMQDVRVHQHIQEELDEGHDQSNVDATQDMWRRDTNNENEESNDGIRNQETREGNQEQELLVDTMMSFTSGSIEFHERFIQAMDKYMVCLHFQEEGRVQNVPQECLCVRNLKEATVIINEINPVLGAFAREFLKLKRPLHIPESCFGNALLDLLRYHMTEAENFFITLRNSLPEECEQYWTSFAWNTNHSTSTTLHGLNQATREQTRSIHHENRNNPETEPNISASQHHQDVAMNSVTPTTEVGGTGEAVAPGELTTAEVQEAQETGLCFPGRRGVRPSIMFKSQDRQNCSKQYKSSKSHSPGLLTVQCACDSPKLIGFVIMTQAESTALALSSILTHFRVPPRAVFYDNACNLFTSVMIRVPWLLGVTRLTVDRFHYKSHKCCAYFSPDSYRQFDLQRTETAESINARIKQSLASTRYLKADNLISFLRVRFALINLSACFQQTYNRTDVEDEDLTQFFNTSVSCSCPGRITIREKENDNRLTTNNGNFESEFQ